MPTIYRLQIRTKSTFTGTGTLQTRIDAIVEETGQAVAPDPGYSLQNSTDFYKLNRDDARKYCKQHFIIIISH